MKIDFETAKKRALKKEDAWVEVLLVDTMTLPIAYFLGKHKPIHPVIVSIVAFVMRMAGAALFFSGHLFYGGVFSFGGFFLDGLDGKLARITQKHIVFHGVVDFLLDQIAFMGMAFGFASYAIRIGDVALNILTILWIVAYFILMSITSTLWRLRSTLRFGSLTAENLATIATENIGNPRIKNTIKKMKNLYFNSRRKLRKHRLLPFPTTIEAEFLFFIVIPLASYLINPFLIRLIASLAILCFVPQMLTNLMETCLLTSISIKKN